MTTQTVRLGREAPFILFIASLMAITALATDAMLPALPAIAADLGAGDGNQQQFVVTLFFVGLGVGQIIHGPLSDSVGRKPVLLVGLALFFLGSLVSIFAPNFSTMLVGRVIQGLGVAASRVLVLAMVRDRFEGNVMARLMSVVMVIFIIVPALAPAVGQAIIAVATWHAIFGLFAMLAVGCAAWLILGQPETLPPARRSAFTPAVLATNLAMLFRSRCALGYTLALSFIFAAFVAYLSAAQQVFQGLYGLGELFPAVFALLALSVGVSSLINAGLVDRYGTIKLVRWSLTIFCIVSAVLLAWTVLIGQALSLWALLGGLLICFLCVGLLIGNLNALAMGPMGAAAGAASAVIGSMSTLISTALGTFFAQAYDGTLIPILAGFVSMGICSLLFVLWAQEDSSVSRKT